jgi:putative flippase GtrA
MSGAGVRGFLRFNAVGILGAVVQLGALRLATRCLGIQYVAATLLAVEIAVLHNFVWHELWTWRELPWRGWPARLIRFELGNGVTSMISNGLLTVFFHEVVGLPVLAGNLAAMVVTGLVNFGVARYWVFQR